ncbi:hypothetical protein HPB51_007517 [Rhipicephalus microplus]|uniref:ABC transmembrane type-1 domain-containing protein n=1 Tax=Rhipicephalus microplus TaxID=6941 RepID=A0A9J6E8E7_RHIMP|nr:hypothetical protein HPB51_007517 [Rhipicephalus microplus]
MNRLSRVLHHEMLEHVLFSPVSFFDATPRGRILNRFTADLNDVDIRMAVLGRQTIQNSLVALSRLAVIGTESIAVIVIGLVVLVIFAVGLVKKADAYLQCVRRLFHEAVDAATARNVENAVSLRTVAFRTAARRQGAAVSVLVVVTKTQLPMAGGRTAQRAAAGESRLRSSWVADLNATRYIRSAHFSRMLQHVTETVDSLTIVRVFRMTERFYAHFCHLADQNLRVSLASVTCSRLTRTFAVAVQPGSRALHAGVHRRRNRHG